MDEDYVPPSFLHTCVVQSMLIRFHPGQIFLFILVEIIGSFNIGERLICQSRMLLNWAEAPLHFKIEGM